MTLDDVSEKTINNMQIAWLYTIFKRKKGKYVGKDLPWRYEERENTSGDFFLFMLLTDFDI